MWAGRKNNFRKGGIGQGGYFSDHNFLKFYGGEMHGELKKILEGDVGKEVRGDVGRELAKLFLVREE